MSLGVGVACILSVGPRFTLVTERNCLAQSLCRRLISQRGSLSWSPNDGTDIRDYLNHASTPTGKFSIEAAVKDECEKDERVQQCQVTAAMNLATQVCTLTLQVVTANGPFVLVIGVDSLTVGILGLTPT